jgi:hypothetical protein
MDLAIFYRFSGLHCNSTGKIGLLLAKDGIELETGRILAEKLIAILFRMLKLLKNGGRKGRQTAIIAPGSYRINTLLFEIELTDMTQFRIMRWELYNDGRKSFRRRTDCR